jgi:hypothetical protein
MPRLRGQIGADFFATDFTNDPTENPVSGFQARIHREKKPGF